jgi:hypothetical protein
MGSSTLSEVRISRHICCEETEWALHSASCEGNFFIHCLSCFFLLLVYIVNPNLWVLPVVSNKFCFQIKLKHTSILQERKKSQNLIFSASSRTATNFCDLPKTPLNMCNHNNKQEMARHELQEVFPSNTKRSRKENHNPLWRVLLLRERSLDGSFLLPLFLSLATATQQKTTFQGTAQARTFCPGRADWIRERALLRFAESSARILKN